MHDEACFPFVVHKLLRRLLFIYKERHKKCKEKHLEKGNRVDGDENKQTEHVGSSKGEKQKGGRTEGKKERREEEKKEWKTPPGCQERAKSTRQQTVREGNTSADKRHNTAVGYDNV